MDKFLEINILNILSNYLSLNNYNDIKIFFDYNHILNDHFNYKNNKIKIFNFLMDNNNVIFNKCNYFKRMKRNYYYDKNER